MPDSFAYSLRRVANRVLHPLGLHLARRDRAFEMEDLLRGAHQRGFRPRTIIDIGASDGVWSLRARRVFSDAEFILFEPLEERRAALELLHRRYGFHIVTAAAGAAPGQVGFSVDPALDGSGVAPGNALGSRNVRVDTIDRAVGQAGLTGPFCLKLDTHGYELPVLAGAARVLAATELLIIEAYNFDLMPGSVRFPALCAWLEQRGYRCIDLADPLRRPRDGVLWQCDLAFGPVTSPVFSENRYA